MTPSLFSLSHLSQFSANGQVYRAFNHLIAASMGRLLLIPIHLVAGRCDTVIDGCPVPWEEVHAVLDYPVNLLTDPREIEIAFDALAASGIFSVLHLHKWEADHISPMVNGEEKVIRLTHVSGIRYAVVVA